MKERTLFPATLGNAAALLLVAFLAMFGAPIMPGSVYFARWIGAK